MKTGIVLDSSAPYKDELGKSKTVYIILGIVAAIIGLIGGGFLGAIALCLFSIAIVWGVMHCIAGFKVVKISRQKFLLPRSTEITDETFIECLRSSLLQYGMTVESKKVFSLDIIRINHENIAYDIVFNTEESTFCINPKDTLLGRKQRYPRLYKKAIISVPIIASTIQNILKAE